MKTLIIYAHPNTDGHCPRILKEVESVLKERKKDYEILDLYAMNYDAVMHESEHYTSGGREVSQLNKGIQAKISAADRLIFIYPVWWSMMPAVMKGFFDKVFTPGFAFRFRTMPIFSRIFGGYPVKMLKGKKAAVFLTTGTHRLLTMIFLGNRFKSIIKHDILGFFGIKAKVWHIDKATQMNDRQMRKIRKAVKKGIGWLC